MKSIIPLVAAALLTVGSYAVVAQDAGTATTPDASAAATATTTVGNYGSLMSTLNAGKMVDLSTYTATAAVNCVKLSSLSVASADASALDSALSTHSTVVTDLKAAINGNAEFKGKLDPTNCPVDDVIAVTSETDGSFTVYVDDRD